MRAIVPRHLRVRNGELVEGEPSGGRSGNPKVIDYTHSIRLIEQQCSHEQEMREMKEQHLREMQQKEQAMSLMEADAQRVDKGEMERIMEELARREMELEKRELELAQKEEQSSSTNSHSSEDLPYTLCITEPAKMGCSEVQPRASLGVQVEGLLSASCCFPKHKQGNVEEMEPGKTSNRVEEEMEKTQDALDNLTSLLKKPKKKYKFFNTDLQKAPTPAKQTERTMQSNSLSEHSGRAWAELDESIDCTAADESRDTAQFLEDAIGDHLALRKALVDLQTNTQTQMQEMRDYYENEIRVYAQLLAGEKDQPSKQFRLNSTRVNLPSDDQDNIDRLEPIEHAEEQSHAHSLFDELESAGFEDQY